MSRFIGRQQALEALVKLQKKPNASLVVIKGRRRIGKSRLAEEFSRWFKKCYIFSGLPPDENVTAQDQRTEFIRQLREQSISSAGSQDWGDLFFDLSRASEQGQVLIVLDEITWMGSQDPTFLGKLKIAWDKYFKQNPKCIVVLSGSNSAWIEKKILSKTGFFGRISYRLTLEELPLYYAQDFFGKHKNRLSAYEKLKILAITGGVPRYLEEIQPTETAEENIYRMCYRREGILFHEFDDIFVDLFQKRSERYRELVISIATGSQRMDEIVAHLDRTKGGDISSLLNELSLDEFISRDYHWNLKTGKVGKISQYRLRDNYLRFYIKYILPYKQRIEIDEMPSLPNGWESIIGLQFENLVINNRKALHRLLNIPPHEIIMCNPYFQTETKRQKKCQIDYIIQTKFNTLYLCEIKFSKKEISTDILQEMEEKIARLTRPKNYSIRPVLIHVNGVSDSVLAAEYFSNIIDFGDFFKLIPE